MPLLTNPKMQSCPEPETLLKAPARVPLHKALWALLLLILGIAGCSGAHTPPPPTLTSLAVTPANMSVAAGTNQQMKATGTFSDGSTTDLTSSVPSTPPNPTPTPLHI